MPARVAAMGRAWIRITGLGTPNAAGLVPALIQLGDARAPLARQVGRREPPGAPGGYSLRRGRQAVKEWWWARSAIGWAAQSAQGLTRLRLRRGSSARRSSVRFMSGCEARCPGVLVT